MPLIKSIGRCNSKMGGKLFRQAPRQCLLSTKAFDDNIMQVSRWVDMNNETLNYVHELLADIQCTIDEFSLPSVQKTLNSINHFARQNQYIDVAVLGQFKAGKSSFLNSFLNQLILPVGDIPVTAVITRISYGPQEEITVTFTDGAKKEIARQELKDYVSETDNPGNNKNVALVDVALPALERLQNIRLVDTPGIGSAWKHNTETTTDWFPETGAVLFLTSAERPLSEYELTLLQEIYLFSPEIVIVMSKTDLFTEEHLQQVEEFNLSVLRQQFDRNFPLLRYSVFAQTKACNEAIEQNVLLPLALNQDANFIKILLHKLNSLTNNCLSYLEIMYQTSLQQASDRQKLKETILDEHLHSNFIRQELLLIVGSYKDKNRQQFYAYFNSFRQELESKLKHDFQNIFPAWHGNLYAVSRRYENWINQALIMELKEILLKEEKSFELISSLKKHLSFYLKSFRERLSHNLEQVLGVKARLENFDITMGEIKKPDILIGRAFDSHIDLLWLFFPWFIFKNIFRRYFEKQIDYEIDKNLHRLTSNMNERMNKEMDCLVEQALAYINTELNWIETLLNDNQNKSAYIQERIQQLNSKINKLSI